MSDKILFDTNILLYAYVNHEPAKWKACNKLIEDVFNGDKQGVISNQILGEFANVMIKKMGADVGEVSRIVDELISSKNWLKLDYTTQTLKKALIDSDMYGSPFWDSVIAETMKENGIVEIITENANDFNDIPGIRVTNPFKS